MSRPIYNNLEKDCLVAVSQMLLPLPPIRELKTKPSLFADLEPSEPYYPLVDRPTLLMCLIHFKTLDSDRIWHYGGVAMAGQEIEGDFRV